VFAGGGGHQVAIRWDVVVFVALQPLMPGTHTWHPIEKTALLCWSCWLPVLASTACVYSPFGM
jgi:hypothetical protein